MKQRQLNTQVRCFAAIALLLLTIQIFGHDYWLKPERFFLAANSHTKVRLYVGDDFKIDEERVLQKDRTDSFQIFSASKTQDLLATGEEGQSPVADAEFGVAGNYLIAMMRKPTLITLESAKFKGYLTEEGLDSIVALRAQLGESGKPGRERYSRYLKSLIQVGDRHDETYKLVLHQRLEIVPQANPYTLHHGHHLKVRVLFEGKPLAGVKVVAYNRSGAGDVLTQDARTTSDGMVAFKLDQSGEWLIRLVHMRRCKNCTDADWESFWGSYSFGRN